MPRGLPGEFRELVDAAVADMEDAVKRGLAALGGGWYAAGHQIYRYVHGRLGDSPVLRSQVELLHQNFGFLRQLQYAQRLYWCSWTQMLEALQDDQAQVTRELQRPPLLLLHRSYQRQTQVERERVLNEQLAIGRQQALTSLLGWLAGEPIQKEMT